MRILLFALFGAAFFTGFVVLREAKSAIHEIEAFLLFLISAVLLVGAAIIEGITQARTKMEEMLEDEIADAMKKFEVFIESAELTASKKFEVLFEYVELSAINTGNIVQLLKAHLPTLAEKVPKELQPPPQATKSGAAKSYYYSVNGGQHGPYTLDEVRELRASGVIDDKTLIFKKGGTEWRNLAEFSECAL